MTRLPTCSVLLLAAVCMTDSAYAQTAKEPHRVMNRRPPSVLWVPPNAPYGIIGASSERDRNYLYRVVAAERLVDGTYLVASDGTKDIRLYDQGGRLIQRTGREGGGPGEFRSVSSLEVADSIYVYDRALRRVTVYDLALNFARTIDVRHLTEISRVGRSNGQWYAIRNGEIQPGVAGDLRPSRAAVLTLDEHLAVRDTVAVFPGTLTATFEVAGDVGARIAPFSPRASVDVSGKCIVTVAGREARMDAYTLSGERVLQIRTADTPKSIERSDMEEWASMVLEDVPEVARMQLEPDFRRIPHPDHMPAYNDVLLGKDGYLWVQPFDPPKGEGRTWVVLQPGGIAVATLELPVALNILDAGSDYILGRYTGNGVMEELRVYALHRPNKSARGAYFCG